MASLPVTGTRDRTKFICPGQARPVFRHDLSFLYSVQGSLSHQYLLYEECCRLCEEYCHGHVASVQDDVDVYMSQSENSSAEAVLRHLEEQHNKYKFMEYNLTTKKSRYVQQICHIVRVTTCLENLEMSGNLTAVWKMSEILLKLREMSGKSCLKLFTVSCIFASIQVFSRSLFCVKY